MTIFFGQLRIFHNDNYIIIIILILLIICNYNSNDNNITLVTVLSDHSPRNFINRRIRARNREKEKEKREM